MNTFLALVSLRKLRTIVLASVVLFAGGSHGVLADDPVNPFAGSWSGTIAVLGEIQGTIEWTISDAGRLTGTAHRTTDGLDFTFVGHMASDGDLVIKIDVEGGGGGSGDPWAGEAVINEEGQTVATITATYDGSPLGPGIDLVLTLDLR